MQKKIVLTLITLLLVLLLIGCKKDAGTNTGGGLGADPVNPSTKVSLTEQQATNKISDSILGLVNDMFNAEYGFGFEIEVSGEVGFSGILEPLTIDLKASVSTYLKAYIDFSDIAKSVAEMHTDYNLDVIEAIAELIGVESKNWDFLSLRKESIYLTEGIVYTKKILTDETIVYKAEAFDDAFGIGSTENPLKKLAADYEFSSPISMSDLKRLFEGEILDDLKPLRPDFAKVLEMLGGLYDGAALSFYEDKGIISSILDYSKYKPLLTQSLQDLGEFFACYNDSVYARAKYITSNDYSYIDLFKAQYPEEFLGLAVEVDYDDLPSLLKHLFESTGFKSAFCNVYDTLFSDNQSSEILDSLEAFENFYQTQEASFMSIIDEMIGIEEFKAWFYSISVGSMGTDELWRILESEEGSILFDETYNENYLVWISDNISNLEERRLIEAILKLVPEELTFTGDFNLRNNRLNKIEVAALFDLKIEDYLMKRLTGVSKEADLLLDIKVSFGMKTMFTPFYVVIPQDVINEI